MRTRTRKSTHKNIGTGSGTGPNTCNKDSGTSAVAVFKEHGIIGEVVCHNMPQKSVVITATFTKLPQGKHGFHIHRMGDLPGNSCTGACDHFHCGPPAPHGDAPGANRPRHTGDLGNIEINTRKAQKYFKKSYVLEGVTCEDLWGRAIIVHADEDDLGMGGFPDSLTTGHSGARIGCAIFGRAN